MCVCVGGWVRGYEVTGIHLWLLSSCFAFSQPRQTLTSHSLVSALWSLYCPRLGSHLGKRLLTCACVSSSEKRSHNSSCSESRWGVNEVIPASALGSSGHRAAGD